MKNHIVESYDCAVGEVARRVLHVLSYRPYATSTDLFESFGGCLHHHTSFYRGYTRVAFEGYVSPYCGRFGVGYSYDTRFSCSYSYRTYFYVPLCWSDFVRPVMRRADILKFVREREALDADSVFVPRNAVGDVVLWYLSPNERDRIADKWSFGARSLNLLFHKRVRAYVVDDEALDSFCASLAESLGLSEW